MPATMAYGARAGCLSGVDTIDSLFPARVDSYVAAAGLGKLAKQKVEIVQPAVSMGEGGE